MIKNIIKIDRMRIVLSGVMLVTMLLSAYSQSASVAPTRVFFNNNLGESASKTVSVMNKSNQAQSYQVSFLDFSVDNAQGKPSLVKANRYKHSISPWISATPSFFTIEPGGRVEVKVTLETPNTPEANSVKWGAMSIKLAKEQISPLDEQQNKMGMAIVNTFQIIVYVFQNPPTITEKNAEIYDFKTIVNDDKMTIQLATKNPSPSILDCHTYLEFTNLQTGWSKSTKKKRFTLLPSGSKETNFLLPKGIAKGKYSVMGVVDYGSSSEIKAAEIEIEIK